MMILFQFAAIYAIFTALGALGLRRWQNPPPVKLTTSKMTLWLLIVGMFVAAAAFVATAVALPPFATQGP